MVEHISISFLFQNYFAYMDTWINLWGGWHLYEIMISHSWTLSLHLSHFYFFSQDLSFCPEIFVDLSYSLILHSDFIPLSDLHSYSFVLIMSEIFQKLYFQLIISASDCYYKWGYHGLFGLFWEIWINPLISAWCTLGMLEACSVLSTDI